MLFVYTVPFLLTQKKKEKKKFFNIILLATASSYDNDLGTTVSLTVRGPRRLYFYAKHWTPRDGAGDSQIFFNIWLSHTNYP